MQKYRLTIVEDERDLASLTSNFFSQFEFECSVESTGLAAIETILKTQPDLVLLDLTLPDMDGMDVYKQIKDQFSGKTIILTARTDVIDQVLGLETGADDYVSKPVEPRLLLARARAVLRRRALPAEEGPYSVENIRVDEQFREVYLAGKPLYLSGSEYELLCLLMRHAGKVVSRDQIFRHLKGIEYDGSSRQADNYIASIRAKLGDSHASKIIKTVRTRGYLLVKELGP